MVANECKGLTVAYQDKTTLFSLHLASYRK